MGDPVDAAEPRQISPTAWGQPSAAWGEPSVAEAPDEAVSPAPEPAKVTLGAVLQRLESQMAAVLRTELAGTVDAVEGIHEQLQRVGESLQRIESRLDRLEDRRAEVEVAVSGASSLAVLEQRLDDIDERVSKDLLDAIMAVVRHLEAVQTATSWTLMQELRKL